MIKNIHKIYKEQNELMNERRNYSTSSTSVKQEIFFYYTIFLSIISCCSTFTFPCTGTVTHFTIAIHRIRSTT